MIIDSETKETHVIINDKEELEQFYKIHKGDFGLVTIVGIMTNGY